MDQFVPPLFAIPRELAVELTKMGGLLDACDDAKKLGEAILDLLQGRKRDSDYKLVAFMIFAKCFKSFQAAQTLCRCGFGSDALSLCASMFENVVDLLYIRKASVKRSRRYIQFEQVEKLLQAQKVLRKQRLPRGRRKAYRAFERNLSTQVSGLVRHFPNPHTGWSQKSLFQRAKSVRGEIAYYERYWIYCGHKHTLPMAAIGWTVTLPDGKPSLTIGPDIKEVYSGALSSAEEFLRMCKLFDHDLRLGLAAGIAKAETDLERIAVKVRTEHPELVA